MTDRHARTARRREQVRVNQRRYRARHKLAIKVAENLEVPIARAMVARSWFAVPNMGHIVDTLPV